MVRLFLCVAQCRKAEHTWAYVSIFGASKVQKEPTRTILECIIVFGKKAPQVIVLRHWCQNLNQLLAYGVHKCERARVEADTAIRIRTLCAILQVALDRTTNLRELTTDLVMTASKKLYVEQGVAIAAANHLEVQLRLLSILVRRVVGV